MIACRAQCCVIEGSIAGTRVSQADDVLAE